MSQLTGYYSTGYPDHFTSDDGFVIDKQYHTVTDFLEPYMVRLEHRSLVTLKPQKGFNAVPFDEHQYHQMPIGANWEYCPRNGMVSYRHRAIAIVDFETYDKPRLVEVKLINV